jgi:hypothetical protein
MDGWGLLQMSGEMKGAGTRKLITGLLTGGKIKKEVIEGKNFYFLPLSGIQLKVNTHFP